MFPALQECIQKTQDNLYRGFISTDQTGLPWLDSVCANLQQLLRIVHKYLIFESHGNVGTLETCFLCISQIVTCIRWLEKTIAMEQTPAEKTGKRQPLPQSRQCFLDRIIWCLERLKTTLESGGGPTESVTESNFVTYLDLALSLVGPLTVASEEEYSEGEYDAAYRSVIVESGRIRSVLEALISQTFGFCNVLPEEDRKRVTACCQKVLRECAAMERAAPSETGSSNKKLCASVLEAAIYQLETRVNECLLRLVYETFGDTDRRLLAELRKRIGSTTDEDDMDELTKPFDAYVDRLMQIGLFAISYADDLKVSSAIRSALASIEALDSYLIPSLYLKSDNSTTLLEEHWLDESANLGRLVHEVVDTGAFALSLIELLDSAIDTLEQGYDPAHGLEMVRKAAIFLHHLEETIPETKLQEEPLKQPYTDYRTMTLECRAIVERTQEDPTIDSSRVIKRFRVLLGKLRKIQALASSKGANTKGHAPQKDHCPEQKDTAATSEASPVGKEIEESVRGLFSANQIRMSSTNILYRSRRGEPTKCRLEPVSLLEINTFTDIIKHRQMLAAASLESGSLRRKTPRRNSLRVAIFKKQQRLLTAEMYESIKSDIDLQITEILDELTDLSGTFTKAPPESPKPVQDSSKSLIRKSITNEEIAIEDGHKIRINIFTEL
ncbi:serendipity locus protein alpha-like [Anopheles bellator]|uniref:serendipity locus protein alpha-like n=1 Tax=Anopheles bellator TaxID=139047 RepID=UPI0026481AA9|nr:serendipity locus protein alpha-like [Anopheles bellator]